MSNGSRTKKQVTGKKTTSSPKSVVEEPVDPLKDRPYIADLYYKSFMGDEEASKLLSKAGDFYKDELISPGHISQLFFQDLTFFLRYI